ncbi:hypothetical protein IAD21_01962 [Abditibacteriota bacterium]|nr:hypothetical protein IAD21_01962 [Abditibacteriota bacterium]
MTEPTAFNLTDAALPDGTVDFYTLIGKTSDAESEDIRLRIQALYSEATANRDNRNLKKRREYQTLLELLPPARAALLEAPKRAKYDEFLGKAKSGAAPTDFETFINDLMGFNEQMEEKTGLLATKDKAEPRASVIKTPDASTSTNRTTSSSASTSRPNPANNTSSRPTNNKAASGGGNAYSTGSTPKPSSGGPGGVIGGVGGLVLGLVLGYLALHNIIPAILLGIILAAVGFVALNGKVGNKISS